MNNDFGRLFGALGKLIGRIVREAVKDGNAINTRQGNSGSRYTASVQDTSTRRKKYNLPKAE